MEWWDELLRACAADGPTSECPPNTVVMTEVELDARKVHANHLHLHLNLLFLGHRLYPHQMSYPLYHLLYLNHKMHHLRIHQFYNCHPRSFLSLIEIPQIHYLNR